MINVDLLDNMGTDLSVVNAARASFAKKSEWAGFHGGGTDEPYLKEKDAKLIRYLAEHGHYSPFGHCFLSFAIYCPIFVQAQLLKHKFLRANSESRRYISTDPEFYEPTHWRGKPKDKKQGSEGELDLYVDQQLLWHTQLQTYKMLLEEGVAPEMARMVLPQSMMVNFVWSGSLDAFADMYRLRTSNDAQKETRMVALQMGVYARYLYPESWTALTEDPNVRFSVKYHMSEESIATRIVLDKLNNGR